MGASQGMGHRKMKTGDEYDVHTRWRKVYAWTQRAGATTRVKRSTRRRERHEAKQALALHPCGDPNCTENHGEAEHD